MLPTLILGITIPLRATAAASDSTYATERVRQVVDAAAAVHARPPLGLASFEAHAETEIGVLVRHPDGDEVQAQVEQIAGSVGWRSDGSLLETVTGYRARFLGVTISVLSYLRVPWVVAPLYGDRVPLVFAEDSGTVARADTAGAGPAQGTRGGASAQRRRVPERLVNPFGSDRARYYRFSGGDTVLTLRLPERTVPLVRVVVDPVRVPRDALVFQGEIDLDATDHQIVRVHGQVLGRPRKGSFVTRILSATLQGTFFVDLENAEWEGTWLPRRQWIELEAKAGFAEDRAVVRLVTDFSHVDVNAPVPFPHADTLPGRPLRALHIAPMDSLRGFSAWRHELGTTVAATNASAFDDVTPDLRPSGPPRFRFGTAGLSDVLRYDRVEGLFTGAGGRLDLGDAAPGVYVAAHAGYAWAEHTVRGSLEVDRRGRRWDAGVTAGRTLASTNDFPRSFGARPTILGIFGTDDFDYVDRTSLEAHVRIFDGSGDGLEVRTGAVRDRAPELHVAKAPLGGDFRPLRPAQKGDYGHLLVAATLGGTAGGEYVAPGLSAGASWELARGGLDWQRVEGYARARTQRARWTLAGAVYGGRVFGDPPPPQELFELGSYAERLPGFAYKAFTGDRAVVGALQLMYALPVLEAPIRIRGFFLPAVAPAPSVELHAGCTGASASTARLLDGFGWTGTDGVRASLFLGIRVLGGAMGIGAARPLGQAGRWRFEWTLEPGG